MDTAALLSRRLYPLVASSARLSEGSCQSSHAYDSLGVLADPQLKKEPLQAQLRKEHSEADLADAAQKLRIASIVESTPDAREPVPPAARPAELRGGQGPDAPKAIGETSSAPSGQPIGQEPADMPGVSAAHVQQQVASAFQQPNPNPFSSAFAYTERMNSAFQSG